MKPEDVLKLTKGFESAINKMRKSYVATGLPMESASSRVYGDGMTVLQVGAIHEYGTADIPQRSFVRLPFIIKADDVNKYIKKRMTAVLDGKETADKAMGLVALMTRNIITDAFQTGCWGQWPDITDATKARKGSNMILVDTAILENSIDAVVRSK